MRSNLHEEYLVDRVGKPKAVVLGIKEYLQLLTLAGIDEAQQLPKALAEIRKEQGPRFSSIESFKKHLDTL